jgi:2-dehydro-3-deoxyphosphogluconate aldolase/(4S)-4-hydroxy-2-oxoglutarate aldolase
VSPGFDLDVIERAQSAGVPFIPGVASASEVQAALRAGLDHVKFFPAIPAGGLSVLSAFHGPFPSVRFMPTGGITLATLNDFLVHPAVYAVGGSWMVPKSGLDVGDFDTVERLTRDTVTQIETLN